MNSDEFVYSSILDKLGYFEPKTEDYRIDSNYTGIHIIRGCPDKIDKNTVIAYYPGSFGLFHNGHVSVVEAVINRLKKSTDNYVVVISPANADYPISKYGKESACASNDFRFKQICEALVGVAGNIAIDLGPMLNSVCDVNFPRLVKDFVEGQIEGPIDNLVNKPIVILGKDRKDFALMTHIIDDLEFMYVEDTTGESTSKTLARSDNLQFKKKKVLLRYHRPEELQLFERYFGGCYEKIVPSPIDQEVSLIKETHLKEHNIDFTICKDYVGLGIPYHPLSRKFKHALDVPTAFTHSDDLDVMGKVILDSDVYSGETKRHIESLGGKLISVYDFVDKQDTWDIVDFSDFQTDNFYYPHKDVAVRCSMPAFSYEDHIKYREFLREVKKL